MTDHNQDTATEQQLAQSFIAEQSLAERNIRTPINYDEFRQRVETESAAEIQKIEERRNKARHPVSKQPQQQKKKQRREAPKRAFAFNIDVRSADPLVKKFIGSMAQHALQATMTFDSKERKPAELRQQLDPAYRLMALIYNNFNQSVGTPAEMKDGHLSNLRFGAFLQSGVMIVEAIHLTDAPDATPRQIKMTIHATKINKPHFANSYQREGGEIVGDHDSSWHTV